MAVIKNGFLIKDGEIYDTKIQSYELCKKIIGKNIIYYMKPSKYKRLFHFEVLLSYFEISDVFKMLDYNKYLKKQRKVELMKKTNKLHYMANMAVIYNYPPTYLTQKKFAIYKTCQSLKKRISKS